jgi:hypothetical protein
LSLGQRLERNQAVAPEMRSDGRHQHSLVALGRRAVAELAGVVVAQHQAPSVVRAQV